MTFVSATRFPCARGQKQACRTAFVIAVTFAMLALPAVGQAAPFAQQGLKLVGTGAVGTVIIHGYAVSLSADGNTALVSAPSDASGVGAVWVWTRSGGAWTQQGSKLSGTGATGSAGQGQSVALSADGNTAIVGGINDASGIGAVWVWTRSGSVWTQQGSKLVGSGSPLVAMHQGYSVALSSDGNTAIVGSPDALGADNVTSTGAAWVWTRSGGVWTQQGGRLLASDGVASGAQGSSVALSADGNTALVGGNAGVGAVFVWTRSGGVWTQQGLKLIGTGNTGNSQQGYSVSLSADGNTALVGGQDDATPAGAIWVWTRSGGVWTQQGAKLVGTGSLGPGAHQGYSVSLSADGNMALVGGPNDNTTVGAAWLWKRSGGVWTQFGSKLVGTGSVGTTIDQSWSVSLSGDGHTAMVGGPFDNSNIGASWVFTDTAAPLTELVANGTFAGGTTGWQTFATPDSSYISSGVNNGVFEFSRVPPPPGTSNQATVFQETGVPFVAGSPVLAQFDAGNTSAVRKYLKVLVIDSNFVDFSACTFWLPPNTPLQTYQVKTHTTKLWSNGAIYFYAGTANAPGDTGVFQVDNVSLQYAPAQFADHTECVDPLAPMAPGGGFGANMVTNSDFATNDLPPWTTFGTITAQAPSGVLQMIRSTSTPPAGVVLQSSGLPLPVGQILLANFQLGNSSGVRKRVTAIMHDLDFSDLVACVFWLEPGQALSSHSIIGWTSKAWTNATLSFYAATIGPDQWTLVDNVAYLTAPGLSTPGSTCDKPFAAMDPPSSGLVLSLPIAELGGPEWTSDGGFTPSGSGTAWEAIADTPGTATLTWPDPIDLRRVAAARLTFASWLSAAASEASVQVRPNGSAWEPADMVPASDAWLPVEIDLARYIGDVIEIRFVFDERDPIDRADPDAWRVDELRLEVDPLP